MKRDIYNFYIVDQKLLLEGWVVLCEKKPPENMEVFWIQSFYCNNEMDPQRAKYVQGFVLSLEACQVLTWRIVLLRSVQ